MKSWKSDLRHICGGILLSSVLLFLASALVSGADKPGQTPKSDQATVSGSRNELTVTMREIPVWEVHERVRDTFLYGQPSPSLPQKNSDIQYPALRSSAPVYGLAQFARTVAHLDGGPDSMGGTLSFVLDQSEANSGPYDLLYFDENADHDLTNDKPHRPLKDVPKGLSVMHGSPAQQTWFEPVQVTLSSPGSPESDRRMIELLPCAWKYENQSPIVRFVPAKVHSGRFEVDGRSYEAFLGYEYTLSASLNEPSSALCLVSQEGRRASCVGTEQLNAMRFLDGKYYRFSCTPTGDQLFVHPYEGPLGVLELGAGKRDVKELQMMGELATPTGVVGIGYPLDEKGMPRGTARCEIPAGDYYPRYMTISLGKLRFAFSNNYYGSESGQMRPAGNPVGSIKIRTDKPYVLDFSNKPVVVFKEPLTKGRLLLFAGCPLQIEAVLVDPALDLMIRRLDDMTRAEKRSYKTADGQEQTYDWAPSLDPKVTIARANGEIVAEGVMPFG